MTLVINPEGATSGKVISQSRPAGTKVAAGTTVKIEVDVNQSEYDECSELDPDSCKKDELE